MTILLIVTFKVGAAVFPFRDRFLSLNPWMLRQKKPGGNDQIFLLRWIYFYVWYWDKCLKVLYRDSVGKS